MARPKTKAPDLPELPTRPPAVEDAERADLADQAPAVEGATDLDPEAPAVEGATDLDPEAPAVEGATDLDPKAPAVEGAPRSDLESASSSPKEPALTLVLTWEAAANLSEALDRWEGEYGPPRDLSRFSTLLRDAIDQRHEHPQALLLIAGDDKRSRRDARGLPMLSTLPPPACLIGAQDCPAHHENGGAYCPRCVKSF